MTGLPLFGVLTLAAFRLQRFVTRDTMPGAWIRGRFDDESPLYELVSCSWCLGTWVTFAVFTVAAQFTSIRWPAIQALAAAALVGLAGEWESRG